MAKLTTLIVLVTGIGTLAAGTLEVGALEARALRGPERERTDRTLLEIGTLDGAAVHSSTQFGGEDRESVRLASVSGFEVALDRGELRRVTLSSGGLTRQGDTRRTIDFARLAWDAERDCFLLSATEAEFEALPVDREEVAPVEASVTTVGSPLLTPARGFLGLARVVGADVAADDRPSAKRNAGGSREFLVDWGTIVDLVVEPATGKIYYALAEAGGIAGIGATTHPIPWQALSFQWLSEDGDRAVLAALPLSSGELGSAPAIDEAHDRILERGSFRDVVAGFYGVEAPKMTVRPAKP